MYEPYQSNMCQVYYASNYMFALCRFLYSLLSCVGLDIFVYQTVEFYCCTKQNLLRPINSLDTAAFYCTYRATTALHHFQSLVIKIFYIHSMRRSWLLSLVT
uniref:Uncharacterized protein n=1 Tax=Pyxicephalus adspersus TaxID=30357 RepID=A0AAV3AM07_PYXAD|nr:TPA: hypothetical protein GDO54_014678 [Pyxicephalus adspersus]